MTDKIAVFSTCDSQAEAEQLARRLVELRLAACVQIDPGIRSFYHWQGELTSSTELRLTIKTRRDLFPALAAELRRMHSYEVPEIVAFPIVDATRDYLDWMDKELLPPSDL